MFDIDKIAKKVAEESIDEDVLQEDKEEIPQHVIDENRADLIRERRKELAQMEMYDDPYLNWSGHR